ESGDALLAAASGVVVVDGTPRELAPRVVAQPLPVGSEISRVAGADAQAPAGTAASGWLPGFGGAARDRGQGLSSIFGPAPGADAGASGISGTPGAVGVAAPAGTLWIATLFGAIGGLILN